MHIPNTAALFTLALVPTSLGLTIKTDDASIGYFTYGPTEDTWVLCRPGDVSCQLNYRGTGHTTRDSRAYVEFMTIAKKVEFVGRISSVSETSRLQVVVDDEQPELLEIPSVYQKDLEPVVIWTKEFAQEGKLKVIRVANVDGALLQLDLVVETTGLSQPQRQSQAPQYPVAQPLL